MNLYKRSFSVLWPYWKQLTTASVSAALNAIFSGLMVWMFGPLLMTLFQVNNLPIVGSAASPSDSNSYPGRYQLGESDRFHGCSYPDSSGDTRDNEGLG